MYSSYYEPLNTVGKRNISAEVLSHEFIQDNYDILKIDPKDLTQYYIKNADGFISVSYIQNFKKILVYRAFVTLNIGEKEGNVLSFYNNFDYGIPDDFNTRPNKTENNVYEIVKKKLDGIFSNIKINTEAKLFIYRHHHERLSKDIENEKIRKKFEQRDKILSKILSRMLEKSGLFLIWRLIVDVGEPLFTSLELFVDSNNGDIIVVRDRSDYLNGTGKVFIPDPITSSGSSLCTTNGSLPASTFDPHRKDVILSNLNPADVNGKFHLGGTYCTITDHEPPHFNPPEETLPHFNYSTANRDFLAVMAYYWIDTVQQYLQTELSITDGADYQTSS